MLTWEAIFVLYALAGRARITPGAKLDAILNVGGWKTCKTCKNHIYLAVNIVILCSMHVRIKQP